MKYYIVDTTMNPPQKWIFDTIPQTVAYLERLVLRKFKLSRTQYMQNLIDLGYGYDDDDGWTFTQSMSEYFNIGVIKKGAYVRTNIHEASNHNKYRKEFGD
jgi:hypothetical protein